MATPSKIPEFRLFDFQVENTTYATWDDEKGQDNNKFLVKMFGMGRKRKNILCGMLKDLNHSFMF